MKTISSSNIELTRFPFANPVDKKNYSIDEEDFKKIQPIQEIFKTNYSRECTKRRIDILA